jgi:hypothetical protein
LARRLQEKKHHNAHRDSIFGSPNSIYGRDSIYDCDSWNYRSQKNHLEVKICTRAREGI